MSKRNLSKNEDAPTRRSIIMGAVVGAAVAAAALIPKTAKAARLIKRSAVDKKTGRRLTITVNNAVFNSDQMPSVVPMDGPNNDTGANNFVVVGNIVAVDGVGATGKYLCKGVIFPFSNLRDTPSANAATFVDQNFIIDGVGSILGDALRGYGQAFKFALRCGTL